MSPTTRSAAHWAAVTLLCFSPAWAEPSSRDHVEALTAPELEGRLTGADGTRAATEYLAKQLRGLGAVPLPGNDGFEIPFDFTAGTRDTGSSLQMKAAGVDRGWSGEESVRALSFSDTGTATGPVVFAGYGLVVPESQDFGYDSYAMLDVEDKIVLVLRYFPEEMSQEERSQLARYSGLRYKAMQARERGAKALLVVTGPNSPNAGETVPMTFDTAIAGSGIVAASVSGEVAKALLAAAGKQSLAEAQSSLDDGNPHVTGFALDGVEVTVATQVERERRTGANLVGYLPPTSETTLSKPFVVVGAHYDHLGRGAGGNSLARPEESGEVHPGADDNASGVAALLGAAAEIAAGERDRGVVLAFWSGEEMGLLGSSAFVDAPTIELEQVAAYVNFDMVGRMRDNKLSLQAAGSSPVWPRLIEQLNALAGFDIQVQEDPYLPTDSSSFNRLSVPTLNFFTGSHEDYHRPSDTADKLNYEDLDRIAELGGRLVVRLANLEEPPEFVTVARKMEQGGGRDTVRAFTGTIPDYATEVEGLLLSGVIEGGPAEEGGLQGGDVIVEFGGQSIANIYDYTYALDAVKIDEPVKVVYLRDGERHETTIVPRARK